MAYSNVKMDDPNEFWDAFAGPNPWAERSVRAHPVARQEIDMLLVDDAFRQSVVQYFPEFRVFHRSTVEDLIYVTCNSCKAQVQITPSVLRSVSSSRAADYIFSKLTEHRQKCQSPSQIAVEVQQRQTVVSEVKQFARKYTVTE